MNLEDWTVWCYSILKWNSRRNSNRLKPEIRWRVENWNNLLYYIYFQPCTTQCSLSRESLLWDCKLKCIRFQQSEIHLSNCLTSVNISNFMIRLTDTNVSNGDKIKHWRLKPFKIWLFRTSSSKPKCYWNAFDLFIVFLNPPSTKSKSISVSINHLSRPW